MRLITALLNAPSNTGVPETTGVADSGLDLFFEPMNFVENLERMGVGMLIIFVLIGIIIASTVLINKIFSKKKDA